MKNSFYLVTPEQKNNKELLASFEKAAVTQWISSLSTTTPQLAAKLFYDFVIKFNSAGVTAQQRLETAELLRPHFLSIKKSLYVQISKTGFPKGENEQKNFSLLISIEKNFSISYWLSAQALTRRQVGFFQKKNAALSIQRTIKGLTGIVVTYSTMRLATPDWVWIDLHSLYKLSIRLKNETTKIADGTTFLGKDTTPQKSYIEALLYSLADPSSLMPREMQQVLDLSHQISQFVQIEKQPLVSQNIQCVVLNEEDRKPYFSNASSQTDDSKIFLDLTKVYSALNQSNKYCNKELPRFNTHTQIEETSEKMSLELLSHILRQWKGKVLNKRSLFSDRLDRYIAIGLNATHLLQTSSSQVRNNEILVKSFSEKELSCSSFKEGTLSIGSLISYRQSKDEITKRVLGLVNKITIPKLGGEVIFELSLLTQHIYAVSYLKKDTSPKAERQKALLYRIKNHSKEKTYILMDRITHDNGEVMHMFMDNKKFLIILGDKKNIGLGYWQFECRRISESKASKPVKKNIFGF